MGDIQFAFSSAFPELYGQRPGQDLVPGVQEGQDVAQDASAGAGLDQQAPHKEAASGDPYTSKIKHLVKQFETTRTTADHLHVYLQAAEQQAKEAEAQALAQADQEFTPAWRDTGLPMKPSHLQLDPDRMVTAKLVNPKAIMGQYMGLKSKEQLHPPRTYEYNDTTIQPNFLKTTANLEARRKRALPEVALDRVRTTYLKERTWPHLSEDEVTQRIAESEARRREQDLRMPPSQYDAEKKIIASMHHKLNFLRNPRYQLPPSVKMLQSQFQPGPSWGVGSPKTTLDPLDGKLTAIHPPIKSNMTSKPDVVFVVEPSEVLFENYEVGQLYVKTLRIRNVTHVIRSMRLFPPASQYFHLSLPRLPTDTSNIAPGMAAEVVVRFTPDSLADYDDEFAIDTASSRFTVPLRARRAPPELTLAQEMHIGEVLCGNRKVQQFPFLNKGGHGRFRVIPLNYWPDRYQDAPKDMATIGPFEVWPLYYDLNTGDEVVINVAFEPKVMGVHEEGLVLVCENCQVKSFVIKGLASDVDVQLQSIDGMLLTGPGVVSRSIDGSPPGSASTGVSSLSRRLKAEQEPATVSEALLNSPLWFGEVVPGATFTRRMAVRNTTTLPFPYKWEWSGRPRTRAATPPNHLDTASICVDATTLLLPAEDSQDGSKPAVADLAGLSSAQLPGQSHMAAKGLLDLVALGLETEAPFEVFPSEGVLQPRELMEFSITFVPTALNRYLRWAQLLVDKAHPGVGSSSCDTVVVELGMEGVAAPLEYDLSPRVLVLPGVLTPGQQVTRTLTLTNKTRAPATFHFEGLDECLSISPVAGQIPPTGTSALLLRFTAGNTFGTIEQQLICHMQHGVSSPVLVRAEVGHPKLELLTHRLDFGLVRLNGSDTLKLHFRNTSSTCGTEWRIDECVLLDEDEAEGQARDSRRSRTGGEHLTCLEFDPPGGILGPDEEMEVKVVCHGLSDGQHRSIVKLTSPAGEVNCLEAFAAVVTPRAVVSRPKVDLGITFLGVTTRFTFTLKNLALLPLDFSWRSEGMPVSEPGFEGLPADMRIRPETGNLRPGEEIEIQVRITPNVTGPILLYGVCDVQGAPLPTGFLVQSTSRGLDVSYDVLTPEQYERWTAGLKDPRVRKRRDDVDNFTGMTNLSPEVLFRLGNSRLAQPSPPPDPHHHVAHFGAAVPLGEVRSLYLIVTNRTPIATSLDTCLDSFGVDDVSRVTGTAKRLKGGKGGHKTQASKSRDLHLSMESFQQRSTATGRVTSQAPIKLSDTAEKLNPFYSSVGNSMMATRRQQQGSATALGDKGLAVSVSPPRSTLAPWGRAVLELSAFNDMCGDYFDILHIKVGELPEKHVPVRIGVSGTPLVVQKERVLRPGLRDSTSQWITSLGWGQLPVGVPLQKTFYVFNTGSLDMHLAWTFYRYQDDQDCERPDAKLFDLTLTVNASDTMSHLALNDLRTASQLASVFQGRPPGLGNRDVQDASQTGLPAAMSSRLLPAASAFPSEAQLTLRQPSGDMHSLMNRGVSLSLSQALQPEDLMLDEWSDEPAVKLELARHASLDTQPFVVEPAEVVIKGGDSARFVVHFTSERPLQHLGYLHGVQKVMSRESEISLKIWPSGENGESVGAMFSGTFHTYAGQPPAPLKPLRVDLSASTINSFLEPDNKSELSFICSSTQPITHANYNHSITLTNRHSCPVIFSLQTEGPFTITSATPSAPQDPTLFRGTTGISEGLPPPGQPMRPASWEPGFTYLPPADNMDVNIQFLPTPVTTLNDYDLQGALVVHYANGDLQKLPLSAMVMHPALELRHSQQLRPALDPALSSAGVIRPEPAPADAETGLGELSVGDGEQGNEQAAENSGHTRSGDGSVDVGPALTRDLGAPLHFGRVHVQRGKPLEVTLLNPTLVDALWAVTSGDQPPKFCLQSELPQAVYSEAQVGPFTIKPARGSLQGRGIKLPRTQRITITFTPQDSKEYMQRLVFASSKGRQVELLVTGQGSFDETEEHQRVLFQI